MPSSATPSHRKKRLPIPGPGTPPHKTRVPTSKNVPTPATPTITQVRAFCHVMDQHKAEVGIFITIEPVTAKMRQEAQSMGSFEHNRQSYPRLQFWQIDDTYFENPDVINTLVRLPDAWRIRPTQKSERHFDNQQMQFLRG